MSFEARLLGRLKEEQGKFAHDALRRPQTRDAFEYGHRVGMFAGYEAAITVLLNLLDEETKRGNDL